MIIVTIGSDPRCNIRVDDEYASPRHCQVELRPGADPYTGWILRDLGSTNGTRVMRDGVPHNVSLGAWWPLQPGDRILVGRYLMPAFTPQALG